MNKIVKILVASDFLIWSGWGLLFPIFAVFITRQIIGGTLAVVGVAEFIYFGSKAFAQIIFGDYLDIEPNDKRNLRWVLAGSMILSFGALLYLIVHHPWQLYGVEFLTGIGAAMTYPAWYSLFIRHLDPRKKAFSISFHSTAIESGTAVAAVVGGLVANYFGFPFLIYLLFFISLMGSILLFFLLRPIILAEQKEMAESTVDSLPVLPIQAAETKPGILVVRKYGDPVLRDHAKNIKEIDDNIRKLAQQMLVTMYKNNGCGLAAPQVGKLVNLMVVDIGEGPLVLANPKILKKSWRTVLSEEGCLSLPGITLKLKSPRKIEIEGFQISDGPPGGEAGKRVKIKAEGLLARAIKHEIEHLDGILIIDKLMFWKKWGIRKKLNAMREETQKLLKEKQRQKVLKEKVKVQIGKQTEIKKDGNIAKPKEEAPKSIEPPKSETKALVKIDPVQKFGQNKPEA